MQEAMALLKRQAEDSGRDLFDPAQAVAFNPDDMVYMSSTLGIDLTQGDASVTLPLFKGQSPGGEEVFYIITEASDFNVAKRLGVNFAPKLIKAKGSGGEQAVTLENGIMQFKGAVDFAPEHIVEPGPEIFPPARIQAGAKADAEWSSVVVLPSGQVLNAQIVSNASGDHDRLKSIDRETLSVDLSILDGFQGGRQYFYHLVTDASVEIAAALEKGVWAPRMAKLPTAGQSVPTDDSALLGFSPVLNGIADVSTGEDQGFKASIKNGGIDPINVFPYGPENQNYSPLWDAHVSMWTEEAVGAKRVRRITSFDDLGNLVKAGDVTSAFISPDGPGNAWLFELRPTQAIINCPVIAHPKADRVKPAS